VNKKKKRVEGESKQNERRKKKILFVGFILHFRQKKKYSMSDTFFLQKGK